MAGYKFIRNLTIQPPTFNKKKPYRLSQQALCRERSLQSLMRILQSLLALGKFKITNI